MTDKSQETTQASQSDSSSADESKVNTLADKLNSVTWGEAVDGKGDYTDSDDAVTQDQGDAEISNSEEVSQEQESVGEEASEEVENSSQSEEVLPSEQDQENDPNLENRFAKLEKSYKSLEAEFTRRNQRASRQEDELKAKSERIQELESQIRALQGQTEKEPDIISRVREQNPEAAELLDSYGKSIEAKIQAQFQEKFEALQAKLSNAEVEDNLSVFTEKLSEFAKSRYSALEPEFLEVINTLYPTDEELKKAAASDPELYDRVFEKFVVKHRAKVVQAENGVLEKTISPEAKKARDAAIANAKGVTKSKSSSSKEAEEDWSDLTDIKKFVKAPKKYQKAWLAKNGLGDNDPFGNLI